MAKVSTKIINLSLETREVSILGTGGQADTFTLNCGKSIFVPYEVENIQAGSKATIHFYKERES